MVDHLSKEGRSKVMSSIRSKHTKLEDKVTKELWHRGLRIRKNVSGLFGNPDIAIKKKKLVVFIDSCFWHECPLHGKRPESNVDYWNKKLDRNKKRDIEVNEYYNRIGWEVLRIWEHEITDDFILALEKIENYLKLASNKK